MLCCRSKVFSSKYSMSLFSNLSRFDYFKSAATIELFLGSTYSRSIKLNYVRSLVNTVGLTCLCDSKLSGKQSSWSIVLIVLPMVKT